MSAAVWSERVTVEDGRAIVTPPPTLSIYSADEFRSCLAAAHAQSGNGDVVILMGAVEACDEDGLGCLIAAFRRAHENGAHVYLVQPPSHMIDRLCRTGMLPLFRLVESLGEISSHAAGVPHA